MSTYETSKISPNVLNLAMPRGRLSFAPIDDAGLMHGEIDLGNVATFDLTNGVVWKEHEQSYAGIVSMDAKKPANQKWTVKFTPEERSRENMAMFFLADPQKQNTATPDLFTQTGAVVMASSLVVVLNRWIDLGVKYIKPGTLTVDDINVEDMTCGTVRVDYENGLVMFLDGGVAPGNVVVAYKYGSVSIPQFFPRTKPVIGQLRYRGTSEVGPRHEIVAWKVQIAPDAALGLIKPQDFAGLSFSGDVFRIANTCSAAQVASPFFRVLELDNSAIVYPS